MSNYWERRAARDIYEQMEDAEAVASQIAKAYQQASDYLIEKAEDVFEKYRSKYGLTEQEAWNTLNTLQDSTSLEELRQSLAQAASGSEKATLRQQLEAPAYRYRIERLQDMMNQVDSVMNNVYKVENRQTKSFLKQLAEKAYYKTIFNIQKRTKLGFSFSHVSEKQIDKVLNMNWSGKHFSQRIWRNTKKLAKKIKEELLVSLLTGRTDRETAEVIREECGGGANEARRLVRTESAFVSGELTGEAYKECDVEKYRYVSVLDLKTSKICRELDGKVFNVKDKQAGKNYPPMHPWCRSTTIAELPAKVMAKLKRRARDPKTGKNIIIPATMTYKEWYAKYVKGNPEAEAKEKAELNKSADRKQYDKYKEILGNDAPKNFADFQDMKYNDNEDWKYIKADYRRRLELIQHPELKLPNADNAILPELKFTKYLFDPNNKRGYAKGKAFADRLGYGMHNWMKLQESIKRSAALFPAQYLDNNGYGDRYVQKMILYSENGKPANVIVAWIKKEDGSTCLTSAYIKEMK